MCLFRLDRLVPACLGMLAACGDPNPLPPPAFENTVDSTALVAATGTPVTLPSGFSMTEGRQVRLDQPNTADFAFDIRDGQPLMVPGAKLGLPGSAGINPGLLRTPLDFDDVTLAEVNGYVTLDTVHIAVGEVFFVRGRIPALCFFGLPIYGKIEVLSIDPEARSVRFRILVNRNCGYKSLEPGTPTQ